jgi:hypothetical protein
MQNNTKKRSYLEALASDTVSDQAQNFNNQSRNKNLNHDRVLNLDSQSLPPYRQIANLAIQEQLFNKVLGAIKGLQFLARNQIGLERQNNVLIDSTPLSQRPSSSSFNSKSNHLIDLHKSK